MGLFSSLKISAVAALLGVFVFAGPAAALSSGATDTTFAASSKQTICRGAGLSAAECAGGGAGGLGRIIRTIIQLLSIIVGVVAVIMVIVSGLKYITSGGDASKISSAKTALIYALVGLIVVALAQVLVQFVFRQATS